MHHQQNLSQAAHALTSTLANPYAQYSSHYVQALANAARPSTTPDGYTLSSTYIHQHTRPQISQQKPSNHRPAVHQPRQFGSWYQPGNHRCSYQGCHFTGSQNSVEIHMMDRHLINPPGWEKRKKRPEWDADPSLKGKPIPIQGTNIILNTPEALEAWIAERKKRWPTTERAAEKKRKLEEAIERGQIIPQNYSLSRKRPRPDYKQEAREKRFGPGSSRFPQKQNGRQRGREANEPGQIIPQDCSLPRKRPRPDYKQEARENPDAFPQKQNGKQQEKARMSTSHVEQTVSKSSDHLLASDEESASSSDESPEVMSSKPSAIVDRPQEISLSKDVEDQQPKRRPFRKGNAKGPKRPPHNPFASRPTLLRNLLLPEIRITISNLSQAMRFLVDNDFLDGVELTPGEAEGKLIQVLSQSDSHSPPQS